MPKPDYMTEEDYLRLYPDRARAEKVKTRAAFAAERIFSLEARVAELEGLIGRIREAILAEDSGPYLACELLGEVLYSEIMQSKG